MGRTRYTITEDLGGGVKRRRTTNTGGMIGYEAGGLISGIFKLGFRILWWMFFKGPWLAVKYTFVGAGKLTKMAYGKSKILGIFVGIVVFGALIVGIAFLVGELAKFIQEEGILK